MGTAGASAAAEEEEKERLRPVPPARGLSRGPGLLMPAGVGRGSARAVPAGARRANVPPQSPQITGRHQAIRTEQQVE